MSRIIHKLDDDDIEFKVQQLVRMRDGRRFLTDVYFPQFSMHIEINERHHLNTEEADRRRAQDIISETGHEIRPFATTDNFGNPRTLTEIRSEIDDIVEQLRSKKGTAIQDGTFNEWDWENQFSSQKIIQRGVLRVKDNVVFRLQKEALECFGFRGKGYQKGAWRIPDGTGDLVWFPRLFRHDKWTNELSLDGSTITERAEDMKGRQSIANRLLDDNFANAKRIVFAKAKDPLGENMYRYVGTFRADLKASTAEKMVYTLESVEEPVRVSDL